MAQPDPAATLERASAELDQLVYDIRLGIRSQAHFDALETRASAIADLIRSAMRGAGSAAPEVRPIKLTARGAWY